MKKLMFVSLFSIFGLGASACGGEMDLEEEAQAQAPAATTEAKLFGSDACKGVDITVENNYEDGTRAAAILVRQFEYYSASEGRWLTEDVTNQEVPYGSTRTFLDQDLQYAENDTITAWRVHFSYRESDGQWSLTTSQYIDITNDVCHADDNYRLLVD
jgi:hypothetical protein